MTRSPGRTGHRWRQLRAAILAASTHCSLCGEPLEPDAPPRTPRSSTVDHIIPLKHGGPALDPRNLRPAHHGCNTRRENESRRPTPNPSKPW